MRGISAQYRQAALGLISALILPLANTAVWIFLHGFGIVGLRVTLFNETLSTYFAAYARHQHRKSSRTNTMPSMTWFDSDWATQTASTPAGGEVELLAMIVEKQPHLEEWLSAGCPTGALITYVNLFGYPLMRQAPDLYGTFDYVALDGIALAVILRYLFPDVVIRRRSPDLTSLIPPLLDGRTGGNSRSVYLVGGSPTDARKASEHLSLAFPNARILGAKAGCFNSKQEWVVFAEELNDLQPDITLVGMGTPLQDLVAVDLRRRGVSGTIMTCGGFLTQTAQKASYYPKLVDRFNLRWAYRAIREPHVRRRLYRDYPRGAAQVIRDYQSGRDRWSGLIGQRIGEDK